MMFEAIDGKEIYFSNDNNGDCFEVESKQILMFLLTNTMRLTASAGGGCQFTSREGTPLKKKLARCRRPYPLKSPLFHQPSTPTCLVSNVQLTTILPFELNFKEFMNIFLMKASYMIHEIFSRSMAFRNELATELFAKDLRHVLVIIQSL